MSEFGLSTTAAAVNTYDSAIGVFSALLHEIRELSKKKPDATLSASKVKLVNSVLEDLLTFLKAEPEGKYLNTLTDDALPQVSDALMMMAQFAAALDAFKTRYYRYIEEGFLSSGKYYWITEKQIQEWSEVNQ